MIPPTPRFSGLFSIHFLPNTQPVEPAEAERRQAILTQLPAPVTDQIDGQTFFLETTSPEQDNEVKAALERLAPNQTGFLSFFYNVTGEAVERLKTRVKAKIADINNLARSLYTLKSLQLGQVPSDPVSLDNIAARLRMTDAFRQSDQADQAE